MIKINNNKIWLIALSVIVIIICFIAGTVYSSALFRITYSNTGGINNLKLVNSNNQLMLIGSSKNTVIYNGVSHNNNQYTFTNEKSVDFYAVSDKGVCMASLQTIENNLYFYDFFIESFDGKYKNHINLSFQFQLNEHNFVIDNDFNIYIGSDSLKNTIMKFSSKGRLSAQINTGYNTEQLMFFNNKVYCICGGKLYFIENSSLKSISASDRLESPCAFTGNNSICDSQGNLFEFQNNSLVLSADFNSENTYCIKTNNHYLYCNQKSIYGNSIKNPEITVYYNFDITINCAYYFNSYIYVSGYNGGQFYVYKISDDELIVNNTSQQPDNPGTPNKPDSQKTDDSSSLSYSSSIYKFTDNIIYNIEAGTSVTKFKQNIKCNGTITLFNKSGNLKTSGYIGTDMTVVFSKGDRKAEFKIAVNGDLTGEGNINSLDLNKMFNYLLKQASLSNVEIFAGDLNEDSQITNKDLVLISRLINS